MRSLLTAYDALALLEKSSLPTILTEGTDDYRIMRKIEQRLSDIGVDFLPLGGREIVLEVWSNLSADRHKNTMALVDLDLWIYFGIPTKYVGDNILYTKGYSIENDILLDHDLLSLLDSGELLSFKKELDIVCAEHAIQIGNARSGQNCLLKRHVNDIITSGDLTPTLTAMQLGEKHYLSLHFKQALRGKTVFQLLVRQLSRPGRFAKFGYKQIYEIGSAQTGRIFDDLETDIRGWLT